MKSVKKYKISRRLQAPIFEKCQTQKFMLREQSKVPTKRGRVSEYGKQLIEKQRVRYMYSISEKILKNYVRKAVATKSAPSVSVLGQLLEGRLDSVVYKLGIAPTRRMARQIVSHGHITINGKKMTIPSYQVRKSDEIGIREGSVQTKLFRTLLSGGAISPRAEWVSWDAKKHTGAVIDTPIIGDSIFSIPAVLEYYSR